jgi:glycerate kinase
MKVVIAPDSFGGTLTAVEAARAIAAGWASSCPADELALHPMSDGGPGFVDVLAGHLPGAELISVPVSDPLGRPVPATLLSSTPGRSEKRPDVYLESAQAAGLHLVAPEERSPLTASTYGVGLLLAAALDQNPGRIMIGLGGTATTDGGTGALTALGLDIDGSWLAGGAVDPGGLDPRLRDLELLVATDVDNPLLGLSGAAAVYGPQKGASANDIQVLDAGLARWAEQLKRAFGVDVAGMPGAGAAGGLAAGLFALGGRRVAGSTTVLAVSGAADAIDTADLVVTGEGAYDATSLRGKVVGAVAARAAEAALPCLVLAGTVGVGQREMSANGVEAAYALADLAGSAEAARAEPARWLTALAARVSRQWSPRAG